MHDKASNAIVAVTAYYADALADQSKKLTAANRAVDQLGRQLMFEAKKAPKVQAVIAAANEVALQLELIGQVSIVCGKMTEATAPDDETRRILDLEEIRENLKAATSDLSVKIEPAMKKLREALEALPGEDEKDVDE